MNTRKRFFNVPAIMSASLAGSIPARGGDALFTERVISYTADAAFFVFATNVDGDGDTNVLSAS